MAVWPAALHMSQSKICLSWLRTPLNSNERLQMAMDPHSADISRGLQGTRVRGEASERLGKSMTGRRVQLVYLCVSSCRLDQWGWHLIAGSFVPLPRFIFSVAGR